MGNKFLFIDVYTQKMFVENFGSRAIEDCPLIRENLMELTHLGVRLGIPIISVMFDEEGLSEADREKVADTETEQFVGVQSAADFEKASQQYRVDKLDGKLSGFADRTVFVYGVPLESGVKEACENALQIFAKTWLVQDAVKGNNSEEDENIIRELKEKGVKLITTRNLEKFINM